MHTVENAAQCLVVVGELSGDTRHKERSGSRLCHRRGGCAARCDAPEDFPFVRTIGNASHLAPGLYGKADGKLQRLALVVAVWIEFRSRDCLNTLKELLPLRHRKAEQKPSEGRQKSILVTGLQTHSSKKIRTDHLQAIPARFLAAQH